MVLSNLTPRRFSASKNFTRYLLFKVQGMAGFSALPAADESAHQSVPSEKPSSLSARLSFIFDQIDEIDKKREEKDQTLQRIRAWRESKKQMNTQSAETIPSAVESESSELKPVVVKNEAFLENGARIKEVELVHPWPEWIELMERLMHQNYFDYKRKDEDGMLESLGINVPGIPLKEDNQLDFTRDFKAIQTAMVNFGRDRFDLLRSFSRHDLQILVGYGCPTTDKRVVFSGKLLRKHTHLDEGDVCSSCSLRSSCEKAYLLTNKEDEARTIDVMRMLLAYGFNPIDESVTNKALLKMKPVKTVVRKLLHQVVKLSAVPIDPNLTPPIAKKPPPKIKQPPPTPKKRIGRYDVEMKKGDWLCIKCDFLNFAKNTICLQCESKRPKRQLLPGEWECPQCNFLNYRRNTVCFHCEHKRPVDTYIENLSSEKQHIQGTKTNKIPDRASVSNAWNFDFDDDESDGADVAAFEYADSQKLNEDFPLSQPNNGNLRGFDRGSDNMSREQATSRPIGSRVGFNDFDEDEDDDVDNYELVGPNEPAKTSQVNFSDLEAQSESEDDLDNNKDSYGNNKFSRHAQKQYHDKELSDVDFDTDDDLPVHPNWKSSHAANPKKQNKRFNRKSFDSDDALSSSDNEQGFRSRNGTSSKPMHGMRGRHPSNSFSESDSDNDDFKYHNDKQRRNTSSDRFSSSNRGVRMMDRSSSMGRNTYNRENSHRKQSRMTRDTKPPRFDGRGRGGSFEKRRGGSSNKFDSDTSDDRHRRPRMNVR